MFIRSSLDRCCALPVPPRLALLVSAGLLSVTVSASQIMRQSPQADNFQLVPFARTPPPRAAAFCCAGLLSVTASASQMMRQSLLPFAALLGVGFWRKRLNGYHATGLAGCVVSQRAAAEEVNPPPGGEKCFKGRAQVKLVLVECCSGRALAAPHRAHNFEHNFPNSAAHLRHADNQTKSTQLPDANSAGAAPA